MDVGFRGEVAELYRTYRRGYPDAVIEAIVDAFDLTPADVGVDLGCGTGQLTVPLAARLRGVVGVDPESDMLALARRDSTAGNVAWLLGSDADLPAIASVLGAGTVGVVTAATALHWMRADDVFAHTARMVRPGGGFAVVTNGKPLWQLDTSWSRALNAFVAEWTGRAQTHGCGTDDGAQQRYRDGLAAAGLVVSEARVEYAGDLDFDHLAGGMLSAFSERTLPVGEMRARYLDGMRAALGDGPFAEPVRVGLLLGRRT